MPIDASIISRLQTPQFQQRDPLETYGKSLALKGLLGQQDLQALQLQDAQEAQSTNASIKSLFAGNPSATAADVMRIDPTRGLKMRADELKAREQESTIAKNTAQGNKAQWEVDVGKLQHGAALLDLAKDPQSFEQVLRLGQMNGTFKPEFVAQVIQQGYSPQLVETLKAQGLTRAQQLEQQHRANTEAQTAATAAFTPGSNGPVANQAAQDFALKKATASRPVTNVSVSTEKKYGEQFAGAIAKADVDMRDIALKAPELAQRANDIKQTLNSGKIITGTGADVRLAIGKALGLAGASDAETIANTETLSTQLARNTLDAIKASGLGAGNGFSNADRDFLEKAVGGKITLEKETIDRLATIQHGVATAAARKWGTRVKDIPPDALQGTGIRPDPVEVPPLYSAPAAGAAPQASRSEIDAELRRRKVIR